MARLRLLIEKLRALTRRRRDDEALAHEIDLHLRLLEERFRDRGLVPEQARLEARRAFGGIQQLHEEHREARTVRWLAEAAQDVSHASRMLQRQPGFAIVILLTLALGIGANAAVFSVVNAVILRPLPYPSVDRVERVGWDWNGRSAATGALAPFKFTYLREHTRAFEALATWQLWTVESGAGSAGAPLHVLRVSEDFFEVVGTAPTRGRGFTRAEQDSGTGVALLTEVSWRTRFGADPDALGQTILLDDRSVVIAGVLPATFRFPEVSDSIDVVTPLAVRADPSDLGANFPAMGRLRAGVTRAAAQADLDRVFADLRRERPNQSGPDERAVLMRFDEIYLADVTRPLWTLFAGVLVVLLIACTNVANLMLARGTTRLREMAVRAALGASRGRLLRQGIAEGLVMSAIGGVAGVVLGTAGVHVLLGLAPGGIARLDEVRVDAIVLGFAALVITITGVVFGLAATGIGTLPRAGAAVSLATRGSSATRTGRRVRQLMIAVESSLAMLLLVGAVLLVSGFYRLTRTPLGFDPRGVIALTFPRLSAEFQTPARVDAAARMLRGALSAVPGVSAAASVSVAPLAERGWNIPMTIDGRPDATEGAVEWRAVSREYAAVMDLQLLQGRWLTDEDVNAARPVVVVSAGFASRYFPDGHALGQRVWLGVFRGQRRPNASDVPREIVGVVADIRDLGPTRPVRRTVFIPPSGSQPGATGIPAFVVRAAGAVSQDSLRAAVRAADPALPEPILSTMESRLGVRLARDRFSSLLMAVFASVALLLTTIGVYGVVSWIVRHATHEIGIRIALGAGIRRIIRDLLLRGLIPVGLGIGFGGAAAVAGSALFSGLVVGVTTVSTRTAIAAAGVLIAAAAIAAWIPARRALRVDPVAVLRAD